MAYHGMSGHAGIQINLRVPGANTVARSAALHAVARSFVQLSLHAVQLCSAMIQLPLALAAYMQY